MKTEGAQKSSALHPTSAKYPKPCHYGCNECDYDKSQKGILNRYKMANHEGVIFSCNQCDFTAL